MERVSDLAAAGFERYLSLHEHKSLLRFIACGSVDDGKSTVIGRLLYESKMLFKDQLSVLDADSQRFGTRGGDLDDALRLDGLSAEREQGITIDVAYRFFSTGKRMFIVADTPGHEQYSRNMATGASTADLAVILVDARNGVVQQTRRHSYLVSLFGIRHIVLAVDKMDLVDYSQAVFDRTVAEFRDFGRKLGLEDIACIPVSGVQGDNIVARSGNTPWYRGPALMDHLENAQLEDDLQTKPFRMPVQWVNHAQPEFRGFAGTIASGTVRRGDRVRVQPSGRESRVARIVTGCGDSEEAVANESITLTLADDIDISRGDVISTGDAPAAVGDQFEAVIVWMHDAPLLRGRSYLVKIGTGVATATVAPIKYKIDTNTLEHLAADKLELNEIGMCEIELDRAVAFEPYSVNRDLGGFILIDRLTYNTLGLGLLRFALRRSDNVHWQAVDVTRQARASLKGQKPCVLWFTGLSGAGKSTIANIVERRLHAMGRHTCLLDGDNVRHGLSKDLGFTAADRVENIRRVAEVSRLMADAGLIVLAAFISPFRDERRMARSLQAEGEFLEIFVDAPLDVAEARDAKGLYRKARRGELRNFTGIDSPYERPESPEMRIDAATARPADAAEAIVRQLKERGILAAD